MGEQTGYKRFCNSVLLVFAFAISLTALEAQPFTNEQDSTPIIEIPVRTEFRELGRQLEYQVLAESGKSRQNPEDLKAADWQTSKDLHPILPASVQEIIIRFNLVNADADTQRLMIVLDVVWLDFVQCTVIKDQSAEPQVYLAGDMQSFSKRLIRSRNPAFPLELKPGESARIYLQIKSAGLMAFPVQLWQERAYLSQMPDHYLMLGLYFAAMLLLLLYNLILYFILFDRSNLYYALYVLLICISMAAVQGVLAQFFFPESVWISNGGMLLSSNLAFAFIILFVRNFMQVDHHFPRFDIYLRVLFGLCLLTAVLTFILSYTLASRLLYLQLLLVSLSILALAILSVYHKLKLSVYFLIGWACLVIGSLLEYMATHQILDFAFPYRNAIMTGTLLEALIFSAALGARLRYMIREKVRAQTRLQEMEDELELARRIQQRILPRTEPRLPNGHLYVHYNPLFAIGGDFYDFHKLDESHLGVILADVSGHGVAAALDSSTVKIAFQNAIPLADHPAALMGNINRFLTPHIEYRFISALYLLLDLKYMQLKVVCAGHPPPIVIRDGIASPLPIKGLLLGVDESFEYTEYEYDLQSGDRILGFTDGIYEALEQDPQNHGRDALIHNAQNFSQLPAAEFHNQLIEAMQSWRGDQAVIDDITFLTLEVA